MKPIVILFFVQTCLAAQTFTKVSTGPLVTTPGDSRSVNWIDINNDGFIDCMLTNGPSGGQNNMLYLNDGLGNFTTFTGDPVVQDHKPSDGATWADSDNDGDMDCFVANWYGVNNLFYTNDGNTGFTQITTGNLVNDGGYSETASWGDIDNDGLVDLIVANSAGIKKNFMYQNLGGNTFYKVTTGAPVEDVYSSRCVNWTDIDKDGDVDLFVCHENNEDETIYRNDGTGLFTKLSTGPLLTNGGNTMSGSWADFDNDGDLDVFLANDQANNALFRNDGDFNFTLLSSDTVSKTPGRSFSSSWSDVDNDGDLDLFVTNAFQAGTKLVNYFYLNTGSGGFVRINTALTADSSWSYGCAFGDYDNDGFEDLAVATCRFAGTDIPDLLYHNDGNSNAWITLTLKGTVSNRSAIGAKVRLKATINGIPVWQMREISAQNAYCSQNDMRVHFGLGNAAGIDSVKVEWPSGIIQYSTGLDTKQFLTITEDESLLTSLPNRNGETPPVKVFPNPSSGIILLEYGKAFVPGDKIELHDAEGKMIYEKKITDPSEQFRIDLKKYGIKAGSYSLRIFTGTKRLTQKLLIAN